MKKLYEEQTISLYKIQNDLKLNNMRLYRYADGTIPISKMPIELILKLANYLKIEPNILLDKMLEYQEKKYGKFQN